MMDRRSVEVSLSFAAFSSLFSALPARRSSTCRASMAGVERRGCQYGSSPKHSGSFAMCMGLCAMLGVRNRDGQT